MPSPKAAAPGDGAKATAVAGVHVVTIPLAEYADLLECRRFRDLHRSRTGRYAPAPRSPIECDPAVATFLEQRFGKASLKVILEECRRDFGAGRTPSRAAAGRYWQRLRNAQ